MRTSKPIAIAADHRGVELKRRIGAALAAQGLVVSDLGTSSSDLRVDAMDYAVALAKDLRAGRSDFAIGICGSGQMMAMTANRFGFIRAALVHTEQEAVWARQHGDANMLLFGADVVDPASAEKIVGIFLSTPALGGRYAERRRKLAELDPAIAGAP
ncbi:MAG: RpiB/LacA/LacB family sugar-phosphate isomerase [Alphaproteobacteria bacterium]|nr:RpiB/LacA/LacB family sugar-phosphate isomerase [Alphaproteobacteria bacterium]